MVEEPTSTADTRPDTEAGVHPSETMVGAAVIRQAQMTIRSVTPIIGAFYGCFALLYMIAPPVQPGHVYAIAATITALVLLASGPALKRLPDSWTNPVFFLTTITCVAFALTFPALSGDPAQTVVLVITFLGFASVLSSTVITAVVTTLGSLAWGFIARDYEPAVLTHWGINVFAAAVVAVIITWSRTRLLRRLEEEALIIAQARDRLTYQAQQLIQQSRDLRIARDAALASTRAKSHFLANISHELRTPMNVIIGTMELLADTELLGPQRQHIEATKAATETLLELVGNVLDFSSLEARKIVLVDSTFDLRELIAETADLAARGAARKGLHFECTLAPNLPTQVRGDPLRLRQILINLLCNAVKFTETGSIVLAAHIASKAPPHTLRFSILDTGIGISKHEQEHLFQPFTQADSGAARRHGGAGLGLAVSRRLIELMDGSCEIESEPGRGTTFSFEVHLGVALAASAATPAIERTKSSTADSTQTTDQDSKEIRVLIVEDNPINQRVAARLLAKIGYAADIASGGKAALNSLQSHSYDAILMDCMMPEMDGYETTARIRQLSDQGSTTPIIALTANALEGDRDRCLAAGMDDYIAKPVRSQVLAKVLGRWIGHRSGRPGAHEPS